MISLFRLFPLAIIILVLLSLETVVQAFSRSLPAASVGFIRRYSTYTTTTPNVIDRSATSINLEAIESIRKIFSDTFRFPPSTNIGSSPSSDEARLKRNELKQDLLNLCRQRPSSSRQSIRLEVEKIIDQLSPLSPIVDTANSPLLRREWLL
jgi:hypothetical protein